MTGINLRNRFNTGNPPCQGCPDRFVGCHATCERYQQYAKARKAERERNSATREYENFMRFKDIGRTFKCQ